MASDKTLLVIGSSGLIGSEVVDYFCLLGWTVHGIDNNMRADFFGPQDDTRWNCEGDHVCYMSDLSHTRAHYPSWSISKSLDDIFLEIFQAVQAR